MKWSFPVVEVKKNLKWFLENMKWTLVFINNNKLVIKDSVWKKTGHRWNNHCLLILSILHLNWWILQVDYQIHYPQKMQGPNDHRLGVQKEQQSVQVLTVIKPFFFYLLCYLNSTYNWCTLNNCCLILIDVVTGSSTSPSMMTLGRPVSLKYNSQSTPTLNGLIYLLN